MIMEGKPTARSYAYDTPQNAKRLCMMGGIIIILLFIVGCQERQRDDDLVVLAQSGAGV
jgi:hypothetical protein